LAGNAKVLKVLENAKLNNHVQSFFNGLVCIRNFSVAKCALSPITLTCALIKVIMVTVIVGLTPSAITAITTCEIFAQNESSPMDRLTNDCMYYNATACNALEHYNFTTYPSTGLNAPES
jgi:hypothetical protein